MGLIKRDGYNVKGIELPEAYAKINRLYIERGNLARTYFGVSNSRENINEGNSLVELEFSCYVDKNQPIYEQVYVLAKENLFQGWEDDIVVETPAEDEPSEEELIDTMPAEEEIEVETPVDTLPVQEELDETTQEAVNEMNEERVVW